MSPILVWMPSHVSKSLAKRIARLPGVAATTAVTGGTAWLTRSSTAGGVIVSRPPSGTAVPIDVAGISPSSFGRFLPAGDRPFERSLAHGLGLLGAEAAGLRGVGSGGTLVFGSHRVAVAGVVPEPDIGWHELLVSARTAAALGLTALKYVLVWPKPGVPWRSLARSVRGLVPSGAPVRIRGPSRARYLREADTVLPPVMEKTMFGEFWVNPHPRAGDFITIDPAWVQAHIETAAVPVLGPVTCNRRIMPWLRGALAEIAHRGLASLIDPHDYGGCFVPRLIPGVAGASISRHTWGAAIDLNVSKNAMGGQPNQDPRIVAIFERFGFTWGGGWLVPDGMHFEFLRFPRSKA